MSSSRSRCSWARWGSSSRSCRASWSSGSATLVWAFEAPDDRLHGWSSASPRLVYAVGLVAQYVFPGRRMKSAGVRTGTVVLALGVAVVGFFVIPVIGAPIGFVAAIYLLELVKHRAHAPARAATGQALRAVALNVGIELADGARHHHDLGRRGLADARLGRGSSPRPRAIRPVSEITTGRGGDAPSALRCAP